MNFLTQILEENSKFQEILNGLQTKISPIGISGLSDVEKIYMLDAILEKVERPICILTYNEIQAKKLYQDLKKFGQKVWYFPKREIAAYDYIAESKDLPYERIEVLNQIMLSEEHKKPMIIITTIEAIMQKMITKQELYQNKIDFKVGKTYSLDSLKEKLVQLGYERNDLIENKGQFSIRGGIVDVGLSEKIGVRIEFWGDEVDSIRYFQIASQRSTQMLKEITIFPAHEFIVSNLPACIQKIEENYPEEKQDIEMIKSGDYVSKIDKYFDSFYEKQGTILDYLNNNYCIFLDEIGKINQRAKNIQEDNKNLKIALIEKKKIVPNAISNMIKIENINKAIE